MPTTNSTTRKTTSRQNRVSPIKQLADNFAQWLTLRREDDLIKGRVDDLRGAMLATLEEIGEVDEKGHAWIDLPEPIEWTTVDKKGKITTNTYTALKREKRVSARVPDADLSEELLREKGLWLTPKQEKAVRDLQVQAKYVRISVEVDTEAFAGAVFQDVISDAEYEGVLTPERVTWAFQPAS